MNEMTESLRELLVAVADLNDLDGLFEKLIEQEEIEETDGDCGYDESNCGSRLCAECGCLSFKRSRINSAVGRARTALSQSRGDE
jgi:hypothetical protein